MCLIPVMWWGIFTYSPLNNGVVQDLTYIEDALSHEKFLKTQCQEAVQKLQDNLYKDMSAKGWYQMEQAEQQKIQKVKKAVAPGMKTHLQSNGPFCLADLSVWCFQTLFFSIS